MHINPKLPLPIPPTTATGHATPAPKLAAPELGLLLLLLLLLLLHPPELTSQVNELQA
jgi:hypothetical protein